MKHRKYRSKLVSLLPLALAAPLSAHPCSELSAWHAQPNGLAADFAPPVGVVALWRPGGGAVIAPATGIPEAHLACPPNVPCRVDNYNDGLSIADFERYQVGEQIYFALAFTEAEKVEALLPRLLDQNELEQELVFQQAMDLHLKDFETYEEAGVRRWAALFQEGVAIQELAFELTATQLERRVASPQGRMRRLVDFEVVDIAYGTSRYAALFDDAPAQQEFFGDLSVEEFHQISHQLEVLGFRLQDVESWVETPSGQMRFAALFEQAAGADHFYALACDRNGLACAGPAYFADMEGLLIQRTLKLGLEQTSLRLVDLEFPRAQPQLGVGAFAGGESPEAPPSRKSRSQSILFGEDPPVTNPNPHHCTHAGVLHDSGTNGPP